MGRDEIPDQDIGQMENGRSRRRWSGLGAALAAAILLFPKAVSSSGSLCAVVQLQLSQQATQEREAFSAQLQIMNAFPSAPLQDLQVSINISTGSGNAGGLFFVKVSSLQNTNDINGAGTVQPSSTATINWLIIPSPGAGGVNPLGQMYAVSATISYLVNGTSTTVQTFNANITVHPQPLMKLEYALPFEVFGQEPLLLPNTITPVIPFPLAVRATNVGYGTASQFQIQSAQPVITDNKQGLNVDFQLIGTHIGTTTITPSTLLIPFGDIAPGTDSQGYWYMTATLSGQFISFTSTFTHAADLGGQLTSLLQGISTYTLLKDVLVDLPGRDSVPDFLVNETGNRTLMQAQLDSGVQPPAQYILESDQSVPDPVTEVPGALSGTLSGANASLQFNFTQPVSSNVWVHSYAPWPYGNKVGLNYAQRNDGKTISPYNVWISTHFIKSSLTYIYWVNILDLTSSTNTYTIQVSPAGLGQPPSSVTDLAGVTYSSGGAVGLTWSAPGETLVGGGLGYLFGGHYFFDAELSTASFSPANAQVTFTTSTAAGVSQSYVDSGLVGNATNYIALFTQDTNGLMSGISNLATAYTRGEEWA